MEAFLPAEKYIVKEFLTQGVGVIASQDEDLAKWESSRRENVAAQNQWYQIGVPDEDHFLNLDLPIGRQSPHVLNALYKTDFIMTLFIIEARRLYENLPAALNNKDDKEELVKKYFQDFTKEKYNFLLNMQSGQELLDFVRSRCKMHDMAKSSALFYSNAGISGTTFSDTSGKRILLFNAASDIEILKINNGIVENTMTRL